MKPTVKSVLEREAMLWGVTVEMITGHSRKAHITKIRQHAMWRARKETGKPFPLIGRIFNRDHSTVIHNFYKVEREMARHENRA